MNEKDIIHGMLFQTLNIKNDHKYCAEKYQRHHKLYLLQILKINLEHTFQKSLFGTISPDLEEYINTNYDTIIQCDYTNYEFTQRTKRALRRFNSLVNTNRPKDITEETWIDALSSTLYFWKNAHELNIEKTKNTIIANVKDGRDECQAEQIEEAWNCLIKHKLIKALPSRYNKLFKQKVRNI